MNVITIISGGMGQISNKLLSETCGRIPKKVWPYSYSFKSNFNKLKRNLVTLSTWRKWIIIILAFNWNNFGNPNYPKTDKFDILSDIVEKVQFYTILKHLIAAY